MGRMIYKAINRADGVDGHYAVGRSEDGKFYTFWSDNTGWATVGYVFEEEDAKKFVDIFETFHNDKKFNEFTAEQITTFLRKPNGPQFISTDCWIGEVKECPTCKKKRITSCCACGCGTCYTCDYRWTCMPNYISDNLITPLPTKESVDKLRDIFERNRNGGELGVTNLSFQGSKINEDRCYLFGTETFWVAAKPPNWFWRWMQYICFGNRWRRINSPKENGEL